MTYQTAAFTPDDENPFVVPADLATAVANTKTLEQLQADVDACVERICELPLGFDREIVAAAKTVQEVFGDEHVEQFYTEIKQSLIDKFSILPVHTLDEDMMDEARRLARLEAEFALYTQTPEYAAAVAEDEAREEAEAIAIESAWKARRQREIDAEQARVVLTPAADALIKNPAAHDDLVLLARFMAGADAACDIIDRLQSDAPYHRATQPERLTLAAAIENIEIDDDGSVARKTLIETFRENAPHGLSRGPVKALDVIIAAGSLGVVDDAKANAALLRVAKRSRREALAQAAREFAAKMDDADDPGAVLDDHRVQLEKLANGMAPAATVSTRIGAAALYAAASMREAMARGTGLAGVSSGLTELDNLLGGLRKGKLYVVGGRPSMGKSALVTNILFDIAARAADGLDPMAGPTVLFSLEMGSEELATRVIADIARIPGEMIERGQVTENQAQKVEAVARELARVPMELVDREAKNLGALVSKARALKRKYGKLAAVGIDYAQLMNDRKSDSRNENRATELSNITGALKSLSMELDCPVLLLAQVKREVEKSDDQRPMLSDLKDSGSLEQDADVVIFVHRNEYYLERKMPDSSRADEFKEWEKKMAAARGRAQLLVPKVRGGGRVGTAEVAWEGCFTKFSDLPHPAKPPVDRA